MSELNGGEAFTKTDKLCERPIAFCTCRAQLEAWELAEGRCAQCVEREAIKEADGIVEDEWGDVW